MNEIKYVGENLLWGQAGHFFVVLAFVTSIFASISYFLGTKDIFHQTAWRYSSRAIYTIHALAVLGIFATLLLMVYNHRFEYQYVWQHSKRDMSMNYILACIWEGQEGSTLLWLLWHSVLGIILMFRAKEWEAPVMSVLALVQVFLSMMLLGLYFGDVHIGSNPFGLVRLQESNIGLPWTQISDYLTNPKTPMFHDGRGLNPLLQNYWMTIHPPTLFCGFALTTIPFAFAMGGLITGRLHDWQRAALPWAFTGVMVLGTGILMGGAWAYESLSFGGFWAWDPVENASLVPWLTLVGAAHVMLIYRIKGQSLFTTFFLCTISFLLIVYSTFLTKSGMLSDSSVHAFTDDGLNEELTAFMGFFLWLSVVLLSFQLRLKLIYTTICLGVLILFLNGHHATAMLIFVLISFASLIISYLKFFPKEEKEEELWSREFWMFIGSLVLLVAAFQISFYTSTPVINKFLRIEGIHSFTNWLYEKTGGFESLARANLAPGDPKDPEGGIIHFYNKWQIPFAVIVALLMAVGQFFKYKNTDFSQFAKQIRRSLIIATVITLPVIVLIYFNGNFDTLPWKKQYSYILCSFLIFTASFSVAANLDYWFKVLKGKIKSAGASIAHIGFAVMLLGIVISTSKKDTISQNTSRMDVKAISSEGSNRENIYLRKGDTLPMGDYLVTYTKKERKIKDGTPYVYFNVDFLSQDKEKEFTLAPFIQLNKFMGNAAEPDTRHFLHKDIYTFVKFVPMDALGEDDEKEKQGADLYDTPQNHTLSKGDTIGLDNCIAILDSISQVDSTHVLYSKDEFCIAAHFTLFDGNMAKTDLHPYFFINKTSGVTRQKDALSEELGVKLTFWKVNPTNGKIDVYSAIQESRKADFIVMEAAIFPGINILWLGCLIMIVGTFLAIRERIRKNKSGKEFADNK
jgi:cytochrome c-type biogenesis protein CcmF